MSAIKRYVNYIKANVRPEVFEGTCKIAAAGEMKWGATSTDYGPRDLSGG